MEYQLDQEIEVDETCKIKLIEHENCDGCFFINKCKNGYRKEIKSKYGECSYMDRKDEKNIIFIKQI